MPPITQITADTVKKSTDLGPICTDVLPPIQSRDFSDGGRISQLLNKQQRITQSNFGRIKVNQSEKHMQIAIRKTRSGSLSNLREYWLEQERAKTVGFQALENWLWPSYVKGIGVYLDSKAPSGGYSGYYGIERFHICVKFRSRLTRSSKSLINLSQEKKNHPQLNCFR